MTARVGEIAAELKINPPPLPKDEIDETVAFLEWLISDNFTFLGARDYVFTDKEGALEPLHETGLGLLRSPERRVLRTGTQLVVVTPELRAFLKEPKLLIVTKSAVRSKVHRRTHMDYIGIKRFNAKGKLVGEFRIVGLFTSTVYTRSTRTIPHLRRKVDAVIKRVGFDPDSHSGKALANVLDTYSRDELFQIDEDTLLQFAMLILQLDERPRVRVLSRPDRFDRFVSVLVFVPRDRYNSTVRVAIGEYLAEVYQGRMSAYYPFFPEGPLVRVHFIIGRDQGECPRPDRATLEETVSNIIRTWTDGLSDALSVVHDPGNARELFLRYRNSFSEGYRAVYSPLVAVNDIKVIAGLSPARPLGADFHRRTETIDGGIGLKVWSHGRPIPLSERVPVLENMGFRVVDEQTHHIRLDADNRPDVWLHDMVLERSGVGDIDLSDSKQRLEACFIVVMTGVAENDGYNALVLSRRPRVARRRADPYHLALPAPDPRALFAGLYVGHARAPRAGRGADRAAISHAVRSASRRAAGGAHRAPGRNRRGDRAGAWRPSRASTKTASSGNSSMRCSRRCAPTITRSMPTAGRRRRSRSNSRAASSKACRCRSRCMRSSSIRRGSRACICASARWRAAASAGRTGRRISAPKSSAW